MFLNCIKIDTYRMVVDNFILKIKDKTEPTLF